MSEIVELDYEARIARLERYNAVLLTAVKKATVELLAEYGNWARDNYQYLWDALAEVEKPQTEEKS